MVESRLRKDGQSIGLLLGQRGRFRGNANGPGIPVRDACPLVQGLAGPGQRLQEQPPHLRLEPPPHDHHAVLVLVDVQGPAHMALRGLPGLGPAIHAPPPADDPLDVGGGARAPHSKGTRFGLRCGDTGESADLGIRQLAAGKGVGEERQRLESADDPDAFTGRPEIEPHPPREGRSCQAEKRGFPLAALVPVRRLAETLALAEATSPAARRASWSPADRRWSAP